MIQIWIISKLLQTQLLSLHVIASLKGVAISSFLGLLRRSAPRNDILLISFVLITPNYIFSADSFSLNIHDLDIQFLVDEFIATRDENGDVIAGIAF